MKKEVLLYNNNTNNPNNETVCNLVDIPYSIVWLLSVLVIGLSIIKVKLLY